MKRFQRAEENLTLAQGSNQEEKHCKASDTPQCHCSATDTFSHLRTEDCHDETESIDADILSHVLACGLETTRDTYNFKLRVSACDSGILQHRSKIVSYYVVSYKHSCQSDPDY